MIFLVLPLLTSGWSVNHYINSPFKKMRFGVDIEEKSIRGNNFFVPSAVTLYALTNESGKGNKVCPDIRQQRHTYH